MRALKALALLLVLLLLPLPALGEEATYSIDVDCYNNIVTVYRASDGAVVRQMICSSGSGASPSPQGNYVMPEPYNRRERKEWYIFAEGYGKYASRIWGNYLFHSYLFNAEDDAAVNEESVISMGTNASHGCIRLYIEDARWISENCLPGTKVRLFWGSTQELYLKELLICDTFRLEDGVSYARFLGAAENDNEIGYGDTGEKVLSLQNTLISLGLYAGEADGTYGPEMVQTVRSLQTALNLPVTGAADSALLTRLSGEDAPVSNLCPLETGDEGPGVLLLQSQLAKTGFYEGTCTGVYDDATARAVRSFQALNSLSGDGAATLETRQALADLEASLDAQYGAGNYSVSYEKQISTVWVTASQKRVNLRARPSTDSAILDYLDPGSRVELLEDLSDGWSQIRYGENIGYINTIYLRQAEEETVIPHLTGSAPAAEAAFEGTALVSNAVQYGRGTSSSRMLVRAQPDSSSECVRKLMSGTVVKVLSVENGWAEISYANVTGYVNASYLSLFTRYEITGSLRP